MQPTLRFFRRPPLVATILVLLLVIGGTALAADPVGRWAVDTAALRGELERLLRADIARMPAVQQAQTEAVLPGRLDQMVHRSAGTAEFHPDGTVLFEDNQGQRRTGRWTLEGDRVHLLSEDEPPYVGPLEGDIMRLEAEAQVEDEPAPGLILRRRRP
jgi:hypothetical protein